MVNSQDSNEPVAWMDPNSGEVCRAHWLESHAPERDVDRFTCALYTAPPQRKPLTEEEIAALPVWKRYVPFTAATKGEIVRAIERAHGIGDPDRCPRCGRDGVHTCIPK